MKTLQTLGCHGGRQTGIFQYKRTNIGVHIDLSIGRSKKLAQKKIDLTHQEWGDILTTIGNQNQNTLRITNQNPANVPPYNSLYALIDVAVPAPSSGFNWHDSYKACICAILEHEGSVDLYHGTLGRNNSAMICLKRDF